MQTRVDFENWGQELTHIVVDADSKIVEAGGCANENWWLGREVRPESIAFGRRPLVVGNDAPDMTIVFPITEIDREYQHGFTLTP